MDEAFATQRSAMTRLRLLAPDGVVLYADKLLDADQAICDLIFKEDGTVKPQSQLPDKAAWREHQAQRDETRQGIVDAFREEIGLGAGVTLATMRAHRSSSP
jgi:hypothetical protein